MWDGIIIIFFRFEFFHNLAILVDRVCVLIPQILYKGFFELWIQFFSFPDVSYIVKFQGSIAFIFKNGIQ